MNDTGVIDNFLNIFTGYIDSGFGLLQGEVGGNLIYKYKSKSIVFDAADWIHFLAALLAKLADENKSDAAGRAAARPIVVERQSRWQVLSLALSRQSENVVFKQSRNVARVWPGSQTGGRATWSYAWDTRSGIDSKSWSKWPRGRSAAT